MMQSKGSRRIFLAHNACLNASYDFNLLKEGLRRKGFELVDRPEDADEVIFSGCAVRDLWVRDAGNQINAILTRAPGTKVTVTGCVANSAPERLRSLVRGESIRFSQQEDIVARYSGLDINELDRCVTQNTTTDFEGARIHDLNQIRRRVGREKAAAAASLDKIDREFGTRLASLYRRSTKGFVFYHEKEPADFIAVTRSCLYKCSFCSIPRGRGAFTSVELDDIVRKAEASVSRGIRRIILVGDEVGNYGAGKSGPKLRDLVSALLKLDSKLRLSIRYIEPKPFIRDFDLFERHCGEGRIELLYVSLQSGSTSILKAMNRNYRIEEVATLCRMLRKNTNTVFYSNWMVGFPGESETDFQATKDLVQDLDLQINVGVPFSARPGTFASTMSDQIDEKVKDERLHELTQLIAALKVSAFSSHLEFLPPLRRSLLLREIELGETVQYAEEPGLDETETSSGFRG
jgi:tRNA-2-methylthio-N6-dimethylallyladenosine synthase